METNVDEEIDEWSIRSGEILSPDTNMSFAFSNIPSNKSNATENDFDNTPSINKKRMGRKKKHPMWNYIKIKEDDEGKRVEARCDICKDSSRWVKEWKNYPKTDIIQQHFRVHHKNITWASPSLNKQNNKKISHPKESLSEDKMLIKQRLEFTESLQKMKYKFGKPPPQDLILHSQLKQEPFYEELQLNTEKFYNLAIFGAKNSGKSTFINAIRGLNDPGATHVDTSTKFLEAKWYQSLHFYKDPIFKNDQCYLCFDMMIIIVKDGEITEEDLKYAEKSKEWNLPVVIVQSKCDDWINKRWVCGEIQNRNLQSIKGEMEIIKSHFANKIATYKDGLLDDLPFFVISGYMLRLLVRSESVEMMFEERGLVNFVCEKLKR